MTLNFSFLNVRPAISEDTHDIVQIHVQAWQESYGGLIDQEYINSLTFEDRLTLRYQIFSIKDSQSHCLVALWQESIVGFSDFGPSRETTESKGEIYSLYLLQAYKNQGIGTEIMKHVRAYFIKAKLLPFMVWVLEENVAARRFYEKQGGIKFNRKMSKMGEMFYPEVCYKFYPEVCYKFNP